jgi:hypothetical protein
MDLNPHIRSAPDSESLKQPQDHNNDHDNIEDHFDRALHRNEAVNKPEYQSNDYEYKNNIH